MVIGDQCGAPDTDGSRVPGLTAVGLEGIGCHERLEASMSGSEGIGARMVGSLDTGGRLPSAGFIGAAASGSVVSGYLEVG